ncbi:hypothetical protein ACN47E_004690 [Coniothyrium glycines]
MAGEQPQKAQALPNPYSLPNPYAQKSLPNPYASATVASAAPVKFTEEQAKAEQQKKAPAFHNPHNIKRPQAKKAGPPVKKPAMPVVSSTPIAAAPSTAATQQHGIDWYRSTADDDAAIIEERRQRNYEEKQRKKEQRKFNKLFGQWNPQAPHKPERYSNLRAYRASGGYRRKKEGFNAFLRSAAAQSKAHDESDISEAPGPVSSSSSRSPEFTAKPSFAPPASYDGPNINADEADPYMHRTHLSQSQDQHAKTSIPRPPPVESPIDFSRSLPPPPTVSDDHEPPPPPPPPASSTQASAAYQGATISAPPIRYTNATISAPPVRYERPDVDMGDADNEPAYDERPAKRPKISKAEAMMAKMGYKKGQGLGKNNDGVVTHLEVKMRKVPQGASTFDEEGGKVKSQQVWDVRGGMRTNKDEPGKFGDESPVVVTWGCIEGIDWAVNADRNDGGVRQEMGEAFSTKFGPVEHIQLDESSTDGAVYIHFKSVLSALNAVNRFDEGWEFRGRKIRAQYYDERKFHAGIYDH